SMAERPNGTGPALPFGRVGAVLRDPQGLWLASDRGLHRATADGFAPLPGLTGPVHALARAAGGGLWIATATGLLRRSAAGELSPLFVEGYPTGRVSGMIEDRRGNLWIASASGLARFRDGHFDTFAEKDGLPDRNVTSVFEDHEGT